ncbi:MAG: DUF692 family multinuclear iron-containing protein [Planctomycetota bacterium]
MRLAVNYSPEAARLLADGRILFDLFKCPNWPHVIDEAAAQHPVYVHFDFRAGRGMPGDTEWSRVDRMLAATETTHVNTHLGPSALDFDGMSLQTTDPADRARLLGAAIADVEELCERFGADRVALENLMWVPDPPWAIPTLALEPRFIRDVVEATGAALVLDLAHARISARRLELDEREYLAALPTAALCELHVTGLRLDDAGLWKDHFPLCEGGWNATGWAFDRIRSGDWPTPPVLAFEYGGVDVPDVYRADEAVLARQVPRLLELVRSVPVRPD